MIHATKSVGTNSTTIFGRADFATEDTEGTEKVGGRGRDTGDRGADNSLSAGLASGGQELGIDEVATKAADELAIARRCEKCKRRARANSRLARQLSRPTRLTAKRKLFEGRLRVSSVPIFDDLFSPAEVASRGALWRVLIAVANERSY